MDAPKPAPFEANSAWAAFWLGHPREGADGNRAYVGTRIPVLGSVVPQATEGIWPPCPAHGGQIQGLSIAGHPAEAQFDMSNTE
ncbi:hypothetical protein [Tateyamaria sp. SN6-1]|uniref:hypothetical protein n=1 Tax=Tateyamaria sp. SN6-1 TaxID=3092148 RepID=UPI0039F47375